MKMLSDPSFMQPKDSKNSQSTSLLRVLRAASDLGQAIDIVELSKSTRTAAEASHACGCHISQIVKSLIFERTDDNSLVLLLIAGSNLVKFDDADKVLGAQISRATPEKIREITGFAIGGVAPIGHLTPLPTYIDPTLMNHESVWAAAGTPNSMFNINPIDLKRITGSQLWE